ncbi:hypothetical protein Cgig2_013223 [Carnegiea gigantea]|uniref:Uncharacterized protein n=1 Tax=Carnegiea gigantea TaxID=171969 RepID=A0A9Q1QLP5_9CARY|nr:hypothetical protein Cgig2_013223 [Carnegiea gigantea]
MKLGPNFCNGRGFKSFCDKVLANLDKMKAVVCGRHATSELSFSLVIGASGSQPNRMEQNVSLDLEDRMGNSAEANEDDFINYIQLIGAEESRSPPRNAQIQHALAVLRIREEARALPQPSIYQQVLTKLRQHPGVGTRGPDFIFATMEYIRREQDTYHFVIFDDEDILDDDGECVVDTLLLYTLAGSSSKQATSPQQRLPKMIVLYGNLLDFYRQLLHLKQDAFIHLVNIMIEKQLLDEGHFVKAAKIVAITLYIFTRGASYRDVKI